MSLKRRARLGLITEEQLLAVSPLEARIRIEWDATIWAEGMTDHFDLRPGQQRIRLNRFGSTSMAERVELIVTLSPSRALSASEWEELQALRRRLSEVDKGNS